MKKKKKAKKKSARTKSDINAHKADKVKSKELEDKRFPVVGLGASAGGLEALKAFFSKVSKSSGMAYIVVVHMMPNQPSMMPELLQKVSCIPVSSVKDGQTIKPDHIYVCLPDKEISIYKGRIQLLDIIKKRGFGLPVDSFLGSLAQDQESNAAAIILSGTGSDGTLGVKEIKANNGLVLVQSAESAAYDGMPGSANKTGLVDMVLAPDEMPGKLIEYFSLCTTLQSSKPAVITNNKDDSQEWMNKIFAILRTRLGHDFSLYKANTIVRRIKRRMEQNRIESHEQYIRFLRENTSETETLFHELLIGVTGFFRDPDSFDVLKTQILPKIFKQMKENDTFRAWIPGCSTGEEVYSLAIIMNECLDTNPKQINLQLFGTDINKYAIEKAREGVFPGSIAAEVNGDRLKRFFVKQGDFFRIHKNIRDNVIFSKQDILRDPPFSRLRLLCCRNLLIYLDTETQKKLMPLFHYTLLPDGILVLGSSETIGGFSTIYKTLDKKWKIYEKREMSPAFLRQIEFPSGQPNREYAVPDVLKIPADHKIDFSREAQRIILDDFSPTALLVDHKGNILHVQGRTGKYLETISGPPTHNILDMAREGLKIELSSAIRSAGSSGKKVIRKHIAINTYGNIQMINLHVCPLHEPKELAGRFLVVFEDIEQRAVSDSKQADSDEYKPGGELSRIAELESELQNTREGHQATIEEMQSSNEELQSINEEMQSSNEELYSANEELESSKEELHSLNKELQTVNAELNNKVDELSAANNDIHNLFNSAEIATIFVDSRMCIKRFTPEAAKIVNLIQTDIGRPLLHVANNLTYKGMITDITRVLDNLSPKNVEVQTNKGQIYNMRIVSYRTIDNRIDGAVLTFTRISSQKKELLQLSKVFLEGADPIIIEDLDGNITQINDEAVRMYGWSREELTGKPAKTIVPPDRHEQIKKLTARCKQSESIRNAEGQRWNKNGDRYNVLITFSLLTDDMGKPFGIASLTKHINEPEKTNES